MAELQQTRPRLERFDARRAPARFADAERHRRRVALLKIALPSLAIACIAAIFISLVFSGRSTPGPEAGIVPAIEMEAPVLTGFSQSGKAYELRASRSVQTREGIIELTDISGHMEMDDGTVAITARTGRVQQEAQHASVEGGVVVVLSNGYRLETESAEADLKAGVVTGNQKVKVDGPMGVSEAEGFRIERSVRRVTFTGGVTSVINPAAANEKATKP
jgi:lipopolysaccharide export system protein LptC